MPRPADGEFAPYFSKYINLVKGDTLQEIISNHAAKLLSFFINLPEDKADYSYAEGKWTVKEVLQHLIDAERIFAYRALRIARKDETPLAGFDENSFAANALSNERTLQSLKDEFNAVRNATDLLFLSFNDEQLQQGGIASNHPVKVNSIVYITFGHLIHHKNILQERYLA